jgi:hypothetical protein
MAESALISMHTRHITSGKMCTKEHGNDGFINNSTSEFPNIRSDNGSIYSRKMICMSNVNNV